MRNLIRWRPAGAGAFSARPAPTRLGRAGGPGRVGVERPCWFALVLGHAISVAVQRDSDRRVAPRCRSGPCRWLLQRS